ncbi:hypothetical protein [Paraburkholderia ferrariae]|jgi:hypothetical protein|nr:hypothetical protein [Paraburkholderia ferrariae]
MIDLACFRPPLAIVLPVRQGGMKPLHYSCLLMRPWRLLSEQV